MSRFYQGVIFDLDGVITETAEYHYQSWKKLADNLGIPFDRKINEGLKGVSRMASLNIILERSTQNYSEEEKKQLTDQKNVDYQRLIRQMTPANLLPGAQKLLDQLKEEGYKMALASSSKNARTVIENLEITDYFDYVADAATIAHGKPNPEIFLTCAKNMDLSPEECIGVEDAVVGIEGIKAAGMLAIGVGDPAILTEADVVIKDLSEFDMDVYQNLK